MEPLHTLLLTTIERCNVSEFADDEAAEDWQHNGWDGEAEQERVDGECKFVNQIVSFRPLN